MFYALAVNCTGIQPGHQALELHYISTTFFVTDAFSRVMRAET